MAVLVVEITTVGFTWYISSGLARYEFVYGSLGAVVALMLWIYFNSLITLFGAHLGAAIARQTGPEQARSSEVECQEAPSK